MSRSRTKVVLSFALLVTSVDWAAMAQDALPAPPPGETPALPPAPAQPAAPPSASTSEPATAPPPDKRGPATGAAAVGTEVSPSANTPPPAGAHSPAALVAGDGAPLAGYYSGLYYIRDAGDTFRLYPRGRVQLDFTAPFGAGVSDLATSFGEKPTIFIRRAQIELDGEVLSNWQWVLAADFGQAATDNSSGTATAPSTSIDPKTGLVKPSTARSAPVEAIAQAARPTDVYVNYKIDRALNIQFGQFKIPVTLENRSSDLTNNFMEAPLGVKNLVAYTQQRDIGAMVWGESHDSVVNYSLGLFNGDGPNRYNQDSNGDLMGRVFFHPFVLTGSDAISKLQIGGSFRYGVRSAKDVGYDVQTFSTQGRYAFWKPTYTDSGANNVHIIPSGKQETLAGELFWPVGPIDLTAEVIYVDFQTRESREFAQLSSPWTDRYGDLKGTAYNINVGAWLLGDRKFIRKAGYNEPPHIDFSKPSSPTEPSLLLVARLEQFNLTYNGASRAGTSDANTPNGDIKVTGFGAALNYYATRHIIASLNYNFYAFPDSAPTSATVKNGAKQTWSERALAPGNNLPVGVNDDARDNAHNLHELSFRLAASF